MKLLLALLSAFVATTTAVSREDYVGDGLYTFSDKTSKWERLKAHVPFNTSATTTSRIKRGHGNLALAPSNYDPSYFPDSKTGNVSWQCEDEWVDENDMIQSWIGLKSWCQLVGSEIGSHWVQAFVVGETIFYYCNYSGDDNNCNAYEVDQAQGWLSTTCNSRTKKAYANFKDSKWAMAYGRTTMDEGHLCFKYYDVGSHL